MTEDNASLIKVRQSVAVNGYQVVEGRTLSAQLALDEQVKKHLVPLPPLSFNERREFEEKLFLDFAFLPFEERAILDFANKHGLLTKGQPGRETSMCVMEDGSVILGERLEFWYEAVAKFECAAFLYRWWSEGGESSKQHLRERIRITPHGAGLLYSSEARELYKQNFPDRFWQTYEPENMLFAHMLHFAGLPHNMQDRARQGDIFFIAKLIFWEFVNKAVQSDLSLRMEASDLMQLSAAIMPGDLLGLLWLQMTLAVTNNKVIKACGREGCTEVWPVGGTDSKATQVYCSTACKQAAYRLRKSRA